MQQSQLEERGLQQRGFAEKAHQRRLEQRGLEQSECDNSTTVRFQIVVQAVSISQADIARIEATLTLT